MRRYRILHRTYYNFAAAVRLEPHWLRLRPRESHELRIEAFELKIQPSATLRWHRDAEDNSVAIATFETQAVQLSIVSELILQQFNEAPLDFVVADYAVRYPFAYTVDDRVLLAPYLDCLEPVPGPLLSQWLARVRPVDNARETYVVLQDLGAQIKQAFSYQIREQPGIQSAEETLSCGTGSCRDFAYLFMETARHLGLAARFVSGYLRAPPTAGDFGATHAWAEVYLPGAGWKGFDPTLGALVGTDHFAVAVARLPESVPPIAGSIVGPPGTKLYVGVWVTELR